MMIDHIYVYIKMNMTTYSLNLIFFFVKKSILNQYRFLLLLSFCYFSMFFTHTHTPDNNNNNNIIIMMDLIFFIIKPLDSVFDNRRSVFFLLFVDTQALTTHPQQTQIEKKNFGGKKITDVCVCVFF